MISRTNKRTNKSLATSFWLGGILLLTGNTAYAPPRCKTSFQLVSGLWRCSAALQPAVRKGSASPEPGAQDARPRRTFLELVSEGRAFSAARSAATPGAAATPPRTRRQPITNSQPRTARSNPEPDQWVTTQVDALVRAARAAFEKDEAQKAYERVLDRIVRAIRLRKLSEDQAFVSRFPAFLEYVQALSIGRQPDHELGFLVPDRQYFAETRRYVEIPEFLLAQEFLRSVSRSESLDRAKVFLEGLNRRRAPADQLIFFSYKSRHLGTPDNDDSYRRLLIVVPGNAEKGIPEKWVQFGVTDPGERTRTRNVSVVSAIINSDGTFNSYFKDYYRTYARDGSISIGGRWELGFGDDNCAKCHKSGVLPIFPVEGSVAPAEQPAVEAVNERFRTYGSPRFDKYLDETRFGPGLSSAPEASRSQRFGKGFDGTAVGSSMTCSACHQPAGLGALNWPMDDVLIGSYVKGGQMPFGYSLKTSERADLYQKLIQEYFSIDDANPGILKSWLLGKLH